MSSSQKPRLLYKVNKLGKANTKKVEELQKDFPKLLKRLKLEGPTKWVKNALAFAINRLRKAGFSDAVIEKKYNIKVSETLKKEKAAPKKKAVKKVAAAKAKAPAPKSEKTAKKAVAKKPAKKVAEKKVAAPKKEKAPAKKPAAKKAPTTAKKAK